MVVDEFFRASSPDVEYPAAFVSSQEVGAGMLVLLWAPPCGRCELRILCCCLISIIVVVVVVVVLRTLVFTSTAIPLFVLRRLVSRDEVLAFAVRSRPNTSFLT